MATMTRTPAARSSALRLALQTDALVCSASSIALIAAARPLVTLTGIPALDLGIVGGVLLAYTAWLWYVVTRPAISRRVGWTVVAINLIWVLDSALVLFSGWLPLTNAGWWFVVAQAVVVAALADWQAIALFKTR